MFWDRQNLGHESRNVGHVVSGHIRENGRKDGIGRNAAIEHGEQPFERRQTAHPFVERGLGELSSLMLGVP